MGRLAISLLIPLYRSASFRHSSAHSSATNMHTSTVGNSISAHPLLPLADSTLSGRSCFAFYCLCLLNVCIDILVIVFLTYSGSVQTISFTGLDGRNYRNTGFSDDEISLSPPRHSYILDLGPRHAAYHSVCSDDDLALTSSDDAIGMLYV